MTSELETKLIAYLSRPSCDGRIDRGQLRKEISHLLGYQYDDKTGAIVKR